MLLKPAGIPARSSGEVTLGLDEAEALRLADLEGLYHEKAAETMRISRATFGRIIETARRKVAEAIVGAKAIRIEGGNVQMDTSQSLRMFVCSGCDRKWGEPYGTGRPDACPKCKSLDIHRSPEQRGCGRGGWGSGGRRQRHGCRRIAAGVAS
jgi:predicted DNA-binding protein (UPF0251 family)